jgi:rod shape-determining protein MreC
MLRILQFLYSLRAFLLFVLLEVTAIWLIVENNSPQGAAFFNSSSAIIGSALKTQSDVADFFSLAEANEALVTENASLLGALNGVQTIPDSLAIELDSLLNATYEFKGARVVSNSLRFSQNHLTLNKGSKDGIKPGMGVFNHEGVVGRVKTASLNFSIAISLLNTGMLISSKIKSNGVFGSVNWDGNDSRHAKMLYIGRHVNAQVGDTVITSGFNAVFPEGINIGIISKINSRTDNPNYLDILIALSTDFSKVGYVYLVENTQFNELDSLNIKSEVTNEF